MTFTSPDFLLTQDCNTSMGQGLGPLARASGPAGGMGHPAAHLNLTIPQEEGAGAGRVESPSTGQRNRGPGGTPEGARIGDRRTHFRADRTDAQQGCRPNSLLAAQPGQRTSIACFFNLSVSETTPYRRAGISLCTGVTGGEETDGPWLFRSSCQKRAVCLSDRGLLCSNVVSRLKMFDSQITFRTRYN